MTMNAGNEIFMNNNMKYLYTRDDHGHTERNTLHICCLVGTSVCKFTWTQWQF